MNTTDIIKQGFLRRLKTLKRRYFVLRTSSKYGKSRLEYHESEKKFRSNAAPKRLIYLISCFNIARKDDTKHKFVFALYTREDVFGLICESQEELNSWLEALLNEQKLSENESGNEYSLNYRGFPKSFSLSSMKREYYPPSSHVSSWQVTVKPRGLGTSKNLAGPYLLQLVSQTLSLVKLPSEEVAADFHLMNVRRCGHTDCFFFMEVGRSCATGAGELWMQVEDPILAQHLHEVMLLAMQSLSGDSSSLSRYRQSGGPKQRPTSLLLLTPARARSDTDSSLHKPSLELPSSPTKHPEESSPASSRTSAMFQRLLSVGKRKTEDVSPRFFFRRTQSKSLSIDPCQGGLLGRAQSVDFSRLFSGMDQLNSPETPDSPSKEREIMNFDIDEEPVRTSSNSSASSGRSSEQSHSSVTPAQHQVEAKDVTDEGYDSTRGGDSTPIDVSTSLDGNPSCVTITTPMEDDEVPEDNSSQLEREQQGNIQDVATSRNDNANNVNTDQVRISQRDRSRYEDMSYSFESLNIKEKKDDMSPDEPETPTHLMEHVTMQAKCSPKQRRTSEPVVINTKSQPMTAYSVDHVTAARASPKQRRTSEPPSPSNHKLREMVQIRNSPSSPRRSKTGIPSLASTNGRIAENPDSESDSPTSCRRRLNTKGTGKPSDEYEVMTLKTGKHTYVNMVPGEGLEGSEDGPQYMNFQPGDIPNASEETVEEHSYMNFKPGEIPEDITTEEFPSYMNFSPGSVGTTGTDAESVSPRPKRKHAYENLNLNGTLKEANELESHDYMNFSPLGESEQKIKTKAKSIPSSPRASIGSLLSPNSGRPRRLHIRRESEPTPSGILSDEKTGMLFLDFSKKSKPERVLNYVSLDLSKSKKRSGGKSLNKARPSSISTLPSLNRAWDTGPKSAPLESGYAEIDFDKSQGLRQAIQEHEKTKPQKE